MTDHCPICKYNRHFKMPKNIIDSILSENLIIFAGAGISTENKNVFPLTFLEEICILLKMNKETCFKNSFPQIMTKYESKFGRRKLIEKLFSRMDMIDSHPELYSNATRFHRELKTIYQINTIFTTNWDDFFEKECGAIPFVSSKDFIFFNLPKRRVFKIHGSISDIGSIIATEDDYFRRYKELENELLGNYLKIMLSTKTIVFCGYSLKDTDFQKLLITLQNELSEFYPRFYFVTIDENLDAQFIKKYNLLPIKCDATYFIHRIKSVLIKNQELIDEIKFDRAHKIYHKLINLHHLIIEENLIDRYPSVIFTLAYQDGMMHSFERMFKRLITGEYSSYKHLTEVIRSYDTMLQEYGEKRKFLDVSYINGYLNGLCFLVLDKRAEKNIPLFYLFKKELPVNYAEYKAILEEFKDYHKTSIKFAQKYIQKHGIGKEYVYHHRPDLLS